MLFDAVVLLAAGVLAALLPSFGSYRARLLRTLARRAGAAVPAEQVAVLEARLSRRHRGMAAGILGGGVLALVLSQTWAGAHEAAGGWLILSVAFVAGAAGAALADVLWPGGVPAGTRAARATSPTVDDYLPPLVRVLGRVFVAAGALALASTLVLATTVRFDASTVLNSPVPVLAASVPVLLVLSWLATRRVLDAPQPARDETELYWQDIVRGQTLSSLAVATPLVGLLALVVCGRVLADAAVTAAAAEGSPAPGWSVTLLVAAYVVPLGLVVGGAVASSRPGALTETEHLRERLWGGRSVAGGAGLTKADGAGVAAVDSAGLADV